MDQASLIEKIEKINMPYRIAILLGTLLLLSAAFVFLVYIPKTEQIDSLTKENQLLAQKVAQAKKRAEDLPKFEKEQAHVDGQFQEALKLLPDQREIPSLLRGITQLGSDSGLEFRLFSPQKERPQEFYIEIPVGIEVSGKYHDVAVFFDKVGRMERIVNILDVSIKPVKERSTTLVTTCDAVTYRFKGLADEKAEDGKKPKKGKKK